MANDVSITGTASLNGNPTVERNGIGVCLNVRLTVRVNAPWTQQQIEALMSGQPMTVTIESPKKGPK